MENAQSKLSLFALTRQTLEKPADSKVFIDVFSDLFFTPRLESSSICI
jgi:hypothetical protein